MPHSRRNFLQKLALGLAVAGCGSSSFETSPSAGGPAWEELARGLQGTLLRPGQAGFDRVTVPYNLRFANIVPAGVARCVSTQDVQFALQWALANQVDVVAACSRHCLADYATTTALLLDLSLMNAISYDPLSQELTVNCGARSAAVYEVLQALSVNLPHGDCASVTLAGLALGGGIGYSMRAQGLTCDRLIETKMVTASGQLLTLSETSNPDLFWAIRGAGGGNFGLHTQLRFKTHPVSQVTVFRLHWTSQLTRLLPALLACLYQSPSQMGAQLSVMAQPGTALSLTLAGQYDGTQAQLLQVLQPVLALFAPAQQTIQTLDYWAGQDFLAEPGTPEFLDKRSRFAFQPLATAGCDTVLQFLQNWPGTSVAASWKAYLMGGAVATVAPAATAFPHRQALLLTCIKLVWSAADSSQVVAQNRQWLNMFHQAMQPFTSDSSYQNFADLSLTDPLRAYFGGNLERLVQIKRQVDPANFFRHSQSLPLTL